MARWLVLILLLINVLLFIWGYQRSLPLPNSLPSLPQGIASLYLLGERDAELATGDPPPGMAGTRTTDTLVGAGFQPDVDNPASPDKALFNDLPASHPDRAPNSASQNISQCLELGPFTQQTDAARLLWDLTDQDLKAGMRVAVDKKIHGYWVLIFPGEEEVKAILQQLKASGIQDIQPLTQGQLANAFSLGLYSDQPQAEKRKNEILEKGFKAEIHPRMIEKPLYWIQLTYPQDYPGLNDLFDRLFDAYPTLHFPPGACQDAAVP